MPAHKGPTIQDIVKRTGLSPATISLILNNKGERSFLPETVERVTAAATELGYRKRPSQSAKTPTKKRIAIICPSVMNPYYAILLQGIEQVVRERGYGSCIYTTYWDEETEGEALRGLEQAGVSGVIYTMVPLMPDRTREYAGRMPVVVLGDRGTDLTVDMAELNNYKGGVLIANHLIDLGHRHIAYISTTLDDKHSARVRRLEGIQATFAQRCPEGSVMVRECRVHPREELETTGIEHKVGYELTRACLEGTRVTAFAAVNDMVAYGVLDALLEAGKRVPEDYSVSGFDNIYPSRFQPIDLTTVEHSIEKKGRWAAMLLLDKIAPPHGSARMTGGLLRVEYESFLVKGRTTAPPANANP